MEKKINKKRKIVSILVVGNMDVGKSTLIYSFGQELFLGCHLPTISYDFILKDIEIVNRNKKEIVKAKICDSTGINRERFSWHVFNQIKRTQGLMIVYDVADRQSFEDLNNLMNSIYNYQNIATFPIVIVGNYTRLSDNITRKVTFEEGYTFAKKYNKKFFEVSAKTGDNLNESFLSLITLVYS